MTRTVIVPLDGSESSEIALPIARQLRDRLGGGLKLLSVVEVNAEFDAWIETAPFSLEEELDSWLEERRNYLNELAAQQGDDVETVIRVGRPVGEIRGYVEECGSSIVVMASHGRSGIQQVVLGSVAMSVVHDMHMPVVIVHMQDEGEPVPASLDSVLLPTDGSKFGESVIDEALEILGEPKPVLRLVQVLEHPDWAHRSVNAGLVSQYLEAGREMSEQYLEQLADKLRERGYEAHAELRSGGAAEGILEAAREHRSDLIAMATHGRGSVGRLILGSVAQRVLNRATVPLLLIHMETE